METTDTIVWCPVGEISNARHSYVNGTGEVIDWDVMGDERQSVTVCVNCANILRGVEQ